VKAQAPVSSKGNNNKIQVPNDALKQVTTHK